MLTVSQKLRLASRMDGVFDQTSFNFPASGRKFFLSIFTCFIRYRDGQTKREEYNYDGTRATRTPRLSAIKRALGGIFI